MEEIEIGSWIVDTDKASAGDRMNIIYVAAECDPWSKTGRCLISRFVFKFRQSLTARSLSKIPHDILLQSLGKIISII